MKTTMYWAGKPDSGGAFPVQRDKIDDAKTFGLTFPLEGTCRALL